MQWRETIIIYGLGRGEFAYRLARIRWKRALTVAMSGEEIRMGQLFDVDVLKELYAQISTKPGVDVANFQARLNDLFGLSRSIDDLRNYRLKGPPWKKLADEVMPVSRFLRFRGIESGRLRFPLDNDPPDSWLWLDDEADRVGIEVTIAQARERFHLARELVETGVGRGFVGLSDDAPSTAFELAMSRSRVMYSTDQALSAIESGVRRCLSRKNKARFAGFILLIEAPLSSLPHQRWEAIVDKLRAAATPLPFREVHVIGGAEEEPWGFQLK